MINRLTDSHCVWVDLESPSKEEAADIGKEFGLDGSVQEELARAGSEPRVDLFPHYIYLRLHFPLFKRSTKSNQSRIKEINVVINDKFLITTHYEPLPTIYEYSKIFHLKETLGKDACGGDSLMLFFGLIEKFHKTVEMELKSIDKRLERVEAQVFAEREAAMVREISMISRDVIDFGRALKSHRSVLASLSNTIIKRHGDKYMFELESMKSRHEFIITALEGSRELLAEIKETNDSLLSSKTNDAMKILTAMGFFMFPLTLITGVFSMRTNTPLIGKENDFWLVLVIMALTFFGLYAYLVKKRWV